MDTTYDHEKKRFQFEKEKFNKECKLREREIAIKEKEVQNSQSKITSTNITIWVAIIGIVGAAISSLIQGYNNTELERDKFEFQVILKVATSDSLERNKNNLKFLLDAGIISDKQSKLRKLVNDSSFELNVEEPKNNSSYIISPLLSPFILDSNIKVSDEEIKAFIEKYKIGSKLRKGAKLHVQVNVAIPKTIQLRFNYNNC